MNCFKISFNIITHKNDRLAGISLNSGIPFCMGLKVESAGIIIYRLQILENLEEASLFTLSCVAGRKSARNSRLLLPASQIISV